MSAYCDFGRKHAKTLEYFKIRFMAILEFKTVFGDIIPLPTVYGKKIHF